MPLDESDKKFITDMISEQQKSLVAQLGETFVTAEAAGKMVEQGVSGALEKLDLDSKIESKLGDRKPDPDDKSKGKAKGGDEVDARLQALQAQMQEERAKREAAEASAKDQRLEGQLRAALDAAGIPAARHAHAIAYLKSRQTTDGKPILDFDDAGNPVWRSQRKGYVDAVDLTKGATEWAQSDDGKHYLPARGSQGTGEGAGGPGSRHPTTVPRRQDGSLDTGALGRRLSQALANADIAQ